MSLRELFDRLEVEQDDLQEIATPVFYLQASPPRRLERTRRGLTPEWGYIN